MEKLDLYGWTKYLKKIKHPIPEKTDNIGRVASIKGNIFELHTPRGHKKAEMLGKLLFSYEKCEQPKVGDWIKYLDYGESALIEDVLPRYNQLYRKAAGKETSKQVMVTNVDKAVIIQGVDNDFNLNRIERYLVQVITCNINPVIILNKSDLVDDTGSYIREIEKLQRGIPVFCCSVKTGEGLDKLKKEIFVTASTSVLIGSSGVGKSSLVNELIGADQKTGEISHSTGKGKHTTTTRDLFLLENGAIVIDTPGMREFGVGFEEDATFGEQFPAISKFAEGCRFQDCSHFHEEGCNVIQAMEKGELDPFVYESYLKLVKEQKRFHTTIHDKKMQGKQFGKMAREAQAYRKKYKF